jgi:hypothetical protein
MSEAFLGTPRHRTGAFAGATVCYVIYSSKFEIAIKKAAREPPCNTMF